MCVKIDNRSIAFKVENSNSKEQRNCIKVKIFDLLRKFRVLNVMSPEVKTNHKY